MQLQGALPGKEGKRQRKRWDEGGRGWTHVDAG